MENDLQTAEADKIGLLSAAFAAATNVYERCDFSADLIRAPDHYGRATVLITEHETGRRVAVHYDEGKAEASSVKAVADFTTRVFVDLSGIAEDSSEDGPLQLALSTLSVPLDSIVCAHMKAAHRSLPGHDPSSG